MEAGTPIMRTRRISIGLMVGWLFEGWRGEGVERERGFKEDRGGFGIGLVLSSSGV